MIPAKHRNSNLANQTILWNSTDNVDNYRRHLADPKKKYLLENNGWIDRAITYTYNSHGFRCGEFNPAEQAILTLGCSFTEGVGMPQEQTWPYILAQHLNLPCWNLGVGGGSADMCFRLAKHYLSWLKPTMVVLLCPRPFRMEFFDGHTYTNIQSTQVDQFSYLEFLKLWFAHDENSELNNQKNIFAIAALCQKLDIDFYYCLQQDWIYGKDDTVPLTWARDLAHNGVEDHKFFVRKILRSIERKQSHIEP